MEHSQEPDLLKAALEAAELGGEVLMRHFRDGVEIRNKVDSGSKAYDLVSDADLESEQVIADFLRQRFPEHDLMGEESLADARADAESLWIIDPLDGTNNFAHGVPHFAVSIAHYRAGTPVVGVVYNPAHRETFTAVKGDGALRNGEAASVNTAPGLNHALIGCGFYYDRGEMMRSTLAAIEEFFEHEIHGIRRFGTAALDLCYVGYGLFGGYFEYQLAPWDFAAGRLFVEEAGGRVTTADGKTLPLSRTSIVASNGTLHDEMTRITAKHRPGG